MKMNKDHNIKNASIEEVSSPNIGDMSYIMRMLMHESIQLQAAYLKFATNWMFLKANGRTI